MTVGHNREPYRNGNTDRSAVYGIVLGERLSNSRVSVRLPEARRAVGLLLSAGTGQQMRATRICYRSAASARAQQQMRVKRESIMLRAVGRGSTQCVWFSAFSGPVFSVPLFLSAYRYAPIGAYDCYE